MDKAEGEVKLICDHCKKNTDRLYICPTCEDAVCAERCCAGMNTECFYCENGEE